MKGNGMRGHRRIAVAGIAALVGLSLTAGAALGSTYQPKGEFAPFAECPLNLSTITDCIHTESAGGEVKIGQRNVRLEQPFIVQGGAEGGGEEVSFYGAANGETLVKTPQPVSEGLTQIVAPTPWPKWLQETFNKGIEDEETEVTATIELAAPASEVTLNTERLLIGQGTALGLPVKIRLQNPLLGSNCRLGSIDRPVQLNFTSGAEGSLQGTPGSAKVNKESTLSTVSAAYLVDGTYSLPTASGCGGLLSYFVDPLVDTILGLPSERGENKAILVGELQDAQAEAVRKSE